MGIKLSKLLKRTYVVSEGVQTDITIQSCDDTFETKLFETPPRDIQHLCDPRSITRGIIRTPIVYSIHDSISLSESKPEKKPYLETNLDDLPPYEDTQILDHVIAVNSPLSHIPSSSVREVNISSTDKQISLSDELQDSKSCRIEIENVEIEEKSLIFHSDNLNNYRSCIDQSVIDESIDSFDINVNASKVKCPVRIDSSETVEKVCQKILDELKSENNLNESGEEIFVDGNISDIVESMRKLCIDRSGASVNRYESHIQHKVYNDENHTPVSSRYQNKNYRKDLNKVVQPYVFKSPNQMFSRKPLGEVNKNIQINRGPSGSPLVKLNQDIENSPLKSILPILPPQSEIPVPKSHRSKWDSENTLII